MPRLPRLSTGHLSSITLHHHRNPQTREHRHRAVPAKADVETDTTEQERVGTGIERLQDHRSELDEQIAENYGPWRTPRPERPSMQQRKSSSRSSSASIEIAEAREEAHRPPARVPADDGEPGRRPQGPLQDTREARGRPGGRSLAAQEHWADAAPQATSRTLSWSTSRSPYATLPTSTQSVGRTTKTLRSPARMRVYCTRRPRIYVAPRIAVKTYSPYTYSYIYISEMSHCHASRAHERDGDTEPTAPLAWPAHKSSPLQRS